MIQEEVVGLEDSAVHILEVLEAGVTHQAEAVASAVEDLVAVGVHSDEEI